MRLVARLRDKRSRRLHVNARGAEHVVLGAFALLKVVDVDKRTVRGAQLVELEVVLLLDLDPFVVAHGHVLEVLQTLRVQLVLHLALALVQRADGLEVRLRVGRLEALALFAHLLDGGGDAVALAVQLGGLEVLRGRERGHLAIVVLHEIVELGHHGGVRGGDLAVGHLEELRVGIELELADVRVLIALLLHQLRVVCHEARTRHEVRRILTIGRAVDAGVAVKAHTVAVVADTVAAAAVAAAASEVDLEVDHVGAERNVVRAEQQQLDGVQHARGHAVHLDLLAAGRLRLACDAGARAQVATRRVVQHIGSLGRVGQAVHIHVHLRARRQVGEGEGHQDLAVAAEESSGGIAVEAERQKVRDANVGLVGRVGRERLNGAVVAEEAVVTVARAVDAGTLAGARRRARACVRREVGRSVSGEVILVHLQDVRSEGHVDG